MKHAPALILASASPRRRELLWQLGVPHEVRPANMDEQRFPEESPERYVQRLAHAKAELIFRQQPGGAPVAVLGADTAVVLGEQLLGKPRDRADGAAMLQHLSGHTHRVLTAVALQTVDGVSSHLCDSRVRFREIAAEEAARYWDSGEPADKAGGYAIQGFGAAFIAELQGSYSGVMGLPLFETADLLRRAGIALWQQVAA